MFTFANPGTYLSLGTLFGRGSRTSFLCLGRKPACSLTTVVVVVVVVDVVVVVAGAAEVVVVEDVVLGGSDASDGAEEAAEVELVPLVALALVVVLVGAAVGSGSDGSSVAAVGKVCACAAGSAASAAVVAVSGCATAVVAAPSAVAAELLSSLLLDEQLVAINTAAKAVADKNFVVFIAEPLLLSSRAMMWTGPADNVGDWLFPARIVTPTERQSNGNRKRTYASRHRHPARQH